MKSNLVALILVAVLAGASGAFAQTILDEVGRWLTVKLSETSPQQYAVVSDVPILICDNFDHVESTRRVAPKNMIVVSRKEFEKATQEWSVWNNNIRIEASDAIDLYPPEEQEPDWQPIWEQDRTTKREQITTSELR